MVADDHSGLKKAVREVLPEAFRQRCYVHYLRNARTRLKARSGGGCLQELRWIFDRPSHGEARADLAAWLAKRPRFHLRHTPTSASWPNQVERWFAVISQRAIKRGSFDSFPDLVRTIESFIADYNETAAPFVWVATADSILGKLERLSTRICGTEH